MGRFEQQLLRFQREGAGRCNLGRSKQDTGHRGEKAGWHQGPCDRELRLATLLPVTDEQSRQQGWEDKNKKSST